MKTNLKALETMLFIWATLRDKEKVSDMILMDLANSDEMKAAYDDEFTTESVRKVLSAISNKELINSPIKKESRFWNYNMWMLEDSDMTDLMLSPIKTLNLDDIEMDSEVVFFPGHVDLYKVLDGKLYINFFLLKVDIYGDNSVRIDGKTIKEFIQEKVTEI